MQNHLHLRKTGQGFKKRQIADLITVCENMLEIAHGLVGVQPQYETNFFVHLSDSPGIQNSDEV